MGWGYDSIIELLLVFLWPWVQFGALKKKNLKLRIYIIKMKDLYNETFKTLKKETKDDCRQWKSLLMLINWQN